MYLNSLIATAPVAGTHIGLEHWQAKLDTYMAQQMADDAAHDVSHLRRVAKTALSLADIERADKLVVVTAAYFHDLVNLPKNHPDRAHASSQSAARAIEVLKSEFPEFPLYLLDKVGHAIEAHSFSAGIRPTSIEAKVVQDADRLEALGAIGIARVFYIAGKLGQALFDGADPIARSRSLDDKQFALDHFQIKLLELHKTMQTEGGRQLALANTEYMMRFLGKLAAELAGDMRGTDEQTIEFLTEGYAQ